MMKKTQTAKEIARLFEEKIGDANLISDLFDYLQFDCKIRAFIDPYKLDESIKRFYKLQSVADILKSDSEKSDKICYTNVFLQKIRCVPKGTHPKNYSRLILLNKSCLIS